MVKLPALISTTRWPIFSVLIIFGGLMVLSILPAATPSCTGPSVERCDYVATAKAAVDATSHHPFTPDRGFEVFDQGSTVLVQQADPFGPGWISHASSVLIDKSSCRPCLVGYAYPEPEGRHDTGRGPLMMRTPAEDPVAEAELMERIRMMEAEAPNRQDNPGS
jgi:hypothetical protein